MLLISFSRVSILVLILILGAAWLFVIGNKSMLRIIVSGVFITAVVGYCFIMESRFQSFSYEEINENREQILQEMPSLEISEDELEFYFGIFEQPRIAESLPEGEKSIPVVELQEVLKDIVPEEAIVDHVETYVSEETNEVVSIKYHLNDLEFLISIYNNEANPNEDTAVTVNKCISRHSAKEVFQNINNEEYSKMVRKRNWFAWMKS